MKRRTLLTYAGAGIVAAAAGGVVAWRGLQPQAAGDGAVDILFSQQLASLDGTPHDFAQWRGRPLVVNFWATWCPPCVEEMPELDALQQEFAQKVRFVGIGIDSAANMLKFVQKVPVRYPLLVAGNVGTELSRQLGNATGGLPFTVVIDEKSTLMRQYSGRLNIAELRNVLTTQLA